MPTVYESKSRIHPAWIVAGVTFLIVLASAGIRATPSMLIVPVEQEFGWSRADISAAIAINLALFGIVGPFAASLMNKFGLRRLALTILGVLCLAATMASCVRSQWQFTMLWGVVIGAGTGAISGIFATVVVNRWFDQRRGTVFGFLSAANAAGQLTFLPLLSRITLQYGWRKAVCLVAAVTGMIFAIALRWFKDRPSDVGVVPYGAIEASSDTDVILSPLKMLAAAAKSGEFWILAGSFFICGASTNGLIGTHLISACVDHGIPEVAAASLLASMGLFDLIGTTISGWLTDRFSSRTLLRCYYLLRGVSLLILPFVLSPKSPGLLAFSAFYGLNWVATVPPTVRLAANTFGKHNSGTVFGWLSTAHQLGAAAAAFIAGSIRGYIGDYRDAFWLSGGLCILAAVLFMKRKNSSGDQLLPPQ